MAAHLALSLSEQLVVDAGGCHNFGAADGVGEA
jgi:hypothetical protein